jgi:hypothetical protein
MKSARKEFIIVKKIKIQKRKSLDQSLICLGVKTIKAN